ncbi:MAG: hypothetical protein CM1200mP13_04570 [Candidatus Pelagibacterales bacterium]|nr:MAG: hypothetical protein CM1200mP13_04570 [Pelagibacterales bacterium]
MVEQEQHHRLVLSMLEYHGKWVYEANQVLTLNNFRHKVTLRTDGGNLKTRKRCVIAAMMGAKEYGVATTALVAMGCIMVRHVIQIHAP